MLALVRLSLPSAECLRDRSRLIRLLDEAIDAAGAQLPDRGVVRRTSWRSLGA